MKILSGGFCSKVKIITAQVFPTTPYYCWQLAFYRHLPTLGRQITVKKGRSHFSSKRRLFPYIPFMAYHNISVCFRAGGRRVKISIFHEFPFRCSKKFCRPAADSILMPPTFHIGCSSTKIAQLTQKFEHLFWDKNVLLVIILQLYLYIIGRFCLSVTFLFIPASPPLPCLKLL